MNLAIVSPNKEAYSETFIQEHKKISPNTYFYYYSGYIPTYLEGKGKLNPKYFSNSRKVLYFLKRKIFKSEFTNNQECLINSFRKNKIECVLAEYGTTGSNLLSVCKYLNIKLFVHFHGFDASVYKILDEYREQYKRMFDYSSKIFVVSRDMYSEIHKIGCPKEKIILNPYGPNERFLNIDPTFHEKQSFVSVGRFVNKKAPYYTILAFKKVVEKFPKAKLYFAGDGPLYETCKNLINFYKLEENILLLGVISPSKIENLFGRVSGYIQHSIRSENGDMEGTPVAILEASASGIPVISTFHAGIKEAVKNANTGFLVQEHDVDKMAHFIIELIKNNKLAKELGDNGKEFIKEYYNIDKHISILRNEIFE